MMPNIDLTTNERPERNWYIAGRAYFSKYFLNPSANLRTTSATLVIVFPIFLVAPSESLAPPNRDAKKSKKAVLSILTTAITAPKAFLKFSATPVELSFHALNDFFKIKIAPTTIMIGRATPKNALLVLVKRPITLVNGPCKAIPAGPSEYVAIEATEPAAVPRPLMAPLTPLPIPLPAVLPALTIIPPPALATLADAELKALAPSVSAFAAERRPEAAILRVCLGFLNAVIIISAATLPG